jgi:hypothetical protein
MMSKIQFFANRMREAWLAVLLLSLLLISAGTPPIGQKPTPTPQVPTGFKQVLTALGVHLYKKDYPNGTPDFVQMINLSQGASLKLMYAPISETRAGKGVYGGNDPRFVSQPLSTYWQIAANENKDAFCVTNGLFFYMPEHPTRLAFPLKVDGQVITDGWAIEQYPDQKLILELWGDRANIRNLSKESLYTSSAPDLIAGLTEEANKRAARSVGRTFVGIDDRDGDRKYETVLILNTLTARQSDVAQVLKDFGADKVMMLDGGGSTQLQCKGIHYIKSERLIPQAIAIIAASRPPVSTRLVEPVGWQVSLEGEHVPLNLEIRNTGIVPWLPGEAALALQDSPLGQGSELPIESRVNPGASLSISTTLAAYSNPGIFTTELDWGIVYDDKTYPGETLTLHTIVIPGELADRRSDLAQKVSQWAHEQPDAVETLAMEWIEENTRPAVQIEVMDAVQELRTTDVFLVPLLMLPIAALLFLIILKTQKN